MKEHKQHLQAALARFRAASVLTKCDMLAGLFICLFFFDCSFSGGGKYISVGPLSPRMVFAFAAFALSLPRLFTNFRHHVKNPILLCFGVFLIYLAICGIRGILANNRMNVLLSDVKGFAWLFLVPTVMVSVRTKERLRRILSCIMAGAVVQAVLVFAFNIVCYHEDLGIMELYYPMYRTQLGTINSISESIYRIFMNSCPYLVFACIIALFRQIKSKKIMLRYVAVIVVCLCAVLLSFTRSVYGCVMVVAGCGILAMLLFYRKGFLRHMKFLLVTVMVLAVVIFALEFIFEANYFNFALSRTIGTPPRSSLAVTARYELEGFAASLFAPGGTPGGTSSDDPSSTRPDKPDDSENLKDQEKYIQTTLQSDQLRAVTQAELMELIRQNPLFGNGLGACAVSRDTGLDEYFYLDVLARMGILGLVLYLLPFGLLCLFCLRHLKKLVETPGAVAVLCGIIGFWAITWFNPWMNAALGIAGYALCCAIPKVITADDSSAHI